MKKSRCVLWAGKYGIYNVDWEHLLGMFTKLRKGTNSFVMSVRLSAQNNFAHTEWIFMKFYIWVFFKYQLRTDKLH